MQFCNTPMISGVLVFHARATLAQSIGFQYTLTDGLPMDISYLQQNIKFIFFSKINVILSLVKMFQSII